MNRVLPVLPEVVLLVGLSWSATLAQEGAEEPKGTGFNHHVQNSIGMKLARIPPGKFKMGSPAGEADRRSDENQHDVEITNEFYVGVHEVTQKQFKDVMGFNPSYFSKDGRGKIGVKYGWQPAGGKASVPADTSDFPVENVSWED